MAVVVVTVLEQMSAGSGGGRGGSGRGGSGRQGAIARPMSEDDGGGGSHVVRVSENDTAGGRCVSKDDGGGGRHVVRVSENDTASGKCMSTHRLLAPRLSSTLNRRPIHAQL